MIPDILRDSGKPKYWLIATCSGNVQSELNEIWQTLTVEFHSNGPFQLGVHDHIIGFGRKTSE